MSTRDPRREPDDDAEVSFEGIVDLGSIPPPASGQVDVHRAPTAVASMTDELMDEIRRAKEEAKLLESQKTRVQPKFTVPEDAVGFSDETPTRPGKEKDKNASGERPRRPEAPDLHEPLPADSGLTAAVTEALPAPPASRPKLPPVSRTPLPTPVPASFAETIPRAPASSTAPRRARSAWPWPRILFFVVTLAALIVSAFAVRRYRARLHR